MSERDRGEQSEDRLRYRGACWNCLHKIRKEEVMFLFVRVAIQLFLRQEFVSIWFTRPSSSWMWTCSPRLVRCSRRDAIGTRAKPIKEWFNGNCGIWTGEPVTGKWARRAAERDFSIQNIYANRAFEYWLCWRTQAIPHFSNVRYVVSNARSGNAPEELSQIYQKRRQLAMATASSHLIASQCTGALSPAERGGGRERRRGERMRIIKRAHINMHTFTAGKHCDDRNTSIIYFQLIFAFPFALLSRFYDCLNAAVACFSRLHSAPCIAAPWTPLAERPTDIWS